MVDQTSNVSGEVTIIAAEIELQYGVLSALATTLKIGQSVFEVHRISLERNLPRGVSGAWVIHEGLLCGHIIASRFDMPWAYMVSIGSIVDNIKEATGIDNVQIPPQETIRRAHKTMTHCAERKMASKRQRWRPSDNDLHTLDEEDLICKGKERATDIGPCSYELVADDNSGGVHFLPRYDDSFDEESARVNQHQSALTTCLAATQGLDMDKKPESCGGFLFSIKKTVLRREFKDRVVLRRHPELSASMFPSFSEIYLRSHRRWGVAAFKLVRDVIRICFDLLFYYVMCFPLRIWVISQHRALFDDEETARRRREEETIMLSGLEPTLHERSQQDFSTTPHSDQSPLSGPPMT
ncbi:hypothetical protein LTR67_005879 [Exophiala xenobiotica]